MVTFCRISVPGAGDPFNARQAEPFFSQTTTSNEYQNL